MFGYLGRMFGIPKTGCSTDFLNVHIETRCNAILCVHWDVHALHYTPNAIHSLIQWIPCAMLCHTVCQPFSGVISFNRNMETCFMTVWFAGLNAKTV